LLSDFDLSLTVRSAIMSAKQRSKPRHKFKASTHLNLEPTTATVEQIFTMFLPLPRQINDFESKAQHELMLQKQLPLPIPDNLEDLKQQNEAFLQELQNHFTGKTSKSASPLSQAALLGSPSSIMPLLPYLQHPYAPIPADASQPWSMPQTFAEEGETSIKRSAMGGFVDTPLNLSKPKSAEDSQKSSMKMSSNDGNNNKSHSIDHLASGSKMMPGGPRLPYNLPFNGDETDLFAACRLWPVMAAAAQHHQHHSNATNQSNNLPAMMAANHRDLINDNNFANFSQAMTEASGKNKRNSEQMSLTQSNVGDEKVRVVRQQGGRGRNSVDRDLIGKQ
jgi:hypothetical protein